MDGLYREQAGELDRKKREAMLQKIQQLIHDKAMYAPIWELGFIHAQGPRVADPALGLITGYAFSVPYEEVKLKGK
jgi:peptide/nickel transport system substrate-binding protein